VWGEVIVTAFLVEIACENDEVFFSRGGFMGVAKECCEGNRKKASSGGLCDFHGSAHFLGVGGVPRRGSDDYEVHGVGG